MHAWALLNWPERRNGYIQPVHYPLTALQRRKRMSLNIFFGIAVFTVMRLLTTPFAVAQDTELGAENYRQADANGDGVLVYAEFATFIDLNAADGLGNAARVSSRGMHARAFARVDANGDGTVSPQELQAIQ
jgi:hypothetical protein